jgi:CheY-like chemotaxis protein
MASIQDWKILVVEDEHDTMELVCEVLQYYGISTLSAPTAEVALEYLDQETPTMIIIDLNLPGMDGWTLLERIKKINRVKHAPRIAITAYHSTDLAHKAIAAGFDAFFPKPLDTTSFVRELEMISRN